MQGGAGREKRGEGTWEDGFPEEIQTGLYLIWLWTHSDPLYPFPNSLYLYPNPPATHHVLCIITQPFMHPINPLP